MRTLDPETVAGAVAELCRTAACDLPADVVAALHATRANERNPRARDILQQCIDNARIAADKRLPICQDTGFAVVFAELGCGVAIESPGLSAAITTGIRRGYCEGYLRKSIVDDPLFARANTGDNCPPVIHISSVPGDHLTLTLAPKGGGSENMSQLVMLKPADGRDGVLEAVVEAVIAADGNPCPPTVVGVGVGGTAETAMILGKRALLRPIGQPHPDPAYAELEGEILEQINASGIGPQGLGGDSTALAVHLEHHPCHIASLPVAVCLNCHAARHAQVRL
ncbi:MAG: fumarate hydratase [Planctomycetota bacterium]